MDETLAQAIVDVSGRPYCVFTGEPDHLLTSTIGGNPGVPYHTVINKHVFESLAMNARIALHVRTLYGRAVPEPLPLYPGGTVYGSTLGPVTLGRPAMAATILMGSYDDWERVADYYERTWVGKREEEERTSQWSTVQFSTEKPRGNRAAVRVEHDSRGLSRDLSEWNAVTEGADPDSIRHGDPRETMIYVIVRWSGE